MNKDKQAIIKHAERLYDAKVTHENTLGNSANTIFEMEKEQTPFILRVSGLHDKKRAHINFELCWMSYLSDKMGNIVKPVKSENGNLYEVIQANEQGFILCLFEKAKGKVVDCYNPAEFNEKLFYDLGAIMGDMHRLTIEYDGNVVRPEFEWYNSAFFWPEYNVLIDEEVQRFEKRYVREFRALPKSKDAYGIIHEDIHIFNFFVDEGHIAIFDFDDCQFSWYACDIANAFYHMVQLAIPYQNTKERVDFAEAYLSSYVKGYRQTNKFDGYWVTKLDMFMKYRRAQTYKFIQNNYRDEPANPHQVYLDWMKSDIVNDRPYVSIDYEKFIRGI